MAIVPVPEVVISDEQKGFYEDPARLALGAPATRMAIEAANQAQEREMQLAKAAGRLIVHYSHTGESYRVGLEERELLFQPQVEPQAEVISFPKAA